MERVKEGEWQEKHRYFLKYGKNGTFEGNYQLPNTIFIHIISLDKNAAISEMVLNIAETDINFSEMFMENRVRTGYDKMEN